MHLVLIVFGFAMTGAAIWATDGPGFLLIIPLFVLIMFVAMERSERISYGLEPDTPVKVSVSGLAGFFISAIAGAIAGGIISGPVQQALCSAVGLVWCAG